MFPMRIGIDARFLGPDGKGLGRYTEQLINHLARIDREHDYVVFLRQEQFERFTPPSERFAAALAPFGWYTVAEQLRFPTLIASQRLHLVHFPHFNVPLFTAAPFVVTIHDLIITHFPTRRATTLGTLKYAVKRMGYSFVIHQAIRRARSVITVSEHAKREIVNYFHVPADRVTVTYEAADPHLLSLAGPPDRLGTFGIKPPYLLYVGNAYPHKNLERLLSAFELFSANAHQYQLVLVGRTDYFYRRLEREVSRRGLSGRVVFPGRVDDADLATFYRHARAYVFPSLAEGFGLPPLEAMHFGVPVAASRASCLPEVLGSAALYFNPTDEHDMAAALSTIVNNETVRDGLSTAGRSQVERYSWSRCAEQTLEVYRRALVRREE